MVNEKSGSSVDVFFQRDFFEVETDKVTEDYFDSQRLLDIFLTDPLQIFHQYGTLLYTCSGIYMPWFFSCLN